LEKGWKSNEKQERKTIKKMRNGILELNKKRKEKAPEFETFLSCFLSTLFTFRNFSYVIIFTSSDILSSIRIELNSSSSLYTKYMRTEMTMPNTICGIRVGSEKRF
jgi:hypothetical protein